MPSSAAARTALRVLQTTWFRAVVTIALLGAVATQIDWSRLWDRLATGEPTWFLAALALVVGTLVIGAIRWWLLLEAAAVELTTAQLTRVYSVATFSGTFLPTAIGGDFARVLLLARRGQVLTRVATTVVVDRVSSLVGLLVLAWGCVGLAPGDAPPGAVAFLGFATVGLGVAAVLVLAAAFGAGGRLRSRVPARAVMAARDTRDVLLTFARDRRLVAGVLATSIAFQLLAAAHVVLLARAIDVDLSFAAAGIALALATLVTMVPITIGGFGLREGTYAAILAHASIATTEATLISLLTIAALFIASLPGAFFLVRDGLTPAVERS